MKQFLIYMGLFLLLSSDAHALKVYILSNHDHVGDHNQALGIAKAFDRLSSKRHERRDINTKKMSSLDIKKKVEADLQNEKVVIIGSGEGGLEGIKDLAPQSKLTIGLTSHMFLEGYKDPNVLRKVNFIAVPSHAIPTDIPLELKVLLNPKLIETNGVAHNRDTEVIDKVYKEWAKKELPTSKTYMGVVLGGDAPIPGHIKDIKLFMEEDATRLATYVAQNVDDSFLIVLNGPRTGKHDLNKNELQSVHREGNSDHITKLFITKLNDLGITKLKVFDFQHESTLPYNPFDLALGAVKATKGIVLIPGESTSMVSEAIDTLSPNQVLVYENSAMNDVHKAHLKRELAVGRVSVLKNYHDIQPGETGNDALQASAANAIAQRLWESVNH